MVARTLFAAALVALAAPLVAALQFADGDDSKTVLLQYGSAETSVSVLCPSSDMDLTVSSSSYYTVGAIIKTDAVGDDYDGYTNFTIPFSFDSDVGVETYDVTVGTEKITGTLIIAGITIKDKGVIVSGEDGPGVTVGYTGTMTYDVKAVDTDGNTADVSSATITKRSSLSVDYKEVDFDKTTLSATEFVLALNDYRVGAGMFNVEFELASIEKMGESHETTLKVMRDSSDDPPCVAKGGVVETMDGVAKVMMYNTLNPPRDSPVDKITIKIGDESYDWDKSKSELEPVDQVIAFPVTSYGEATIQCDGEEAVIKDGPLEIKQGAGDTPQLASTLLKDPLQPGDDPIIRAVLRILDTDPETITAPQVQPIIDEFCKVTSGDDCRLTKMEKGSTLATVEAYTSDSDGPDKKLEQAVETCSFQRNTGYDCDKIELMESKVNVVGGAAVPTTGLALWTIILIAGLGAFALIVLIMLGLLAVYRRSAEQSESDYSSSGPLGVPDPSDLLYEQSIVRDIYGRGDYPEGGPTAAVAEQRAREADLREEFPRPPSSSGLSRASDDASSTYSV